MKIQKRVLTDWNNQKTFPTVNKVPCRDAKARRILVFGGWQGFLEQ